MPLPTFTTLPEVHDYIAGNLRRAVKDGKHAWHWPVLSTASECRVVVLRGVSIEPARWRFYTDARSEKMTYIDAGARVGACFYHPRHRTQLRLHGDPKVVTSEEERRKLWSEQSARSKRSYATRHAPGTLLETAGTGLSDRWEDGQPSVEEDEAAFAHFVVVDVLVDGIDFLQLGEHGQRRARGGRLEELRWVVP